MRQVISKYPLLNTVETLTAAGTLIAKVKGQQMGRGQPGRSARQDFLEGALSEVGFEGCTGVWQAQLASP